MKFKRIPMVRSFIIILAIVLPGFSVVANNVRIMGDVQYDIDELSRGNILNLKFNLSWDNSWRDDYNWDAVYVCFKYKLVEPADNYQWHHIYLQGEAKLPADYDCSLAKSQVNFGAGIVNVNTGVFIHRKFNGGGNTSIEVSVPWDVTSNKNCPLDRGMFTRSKVLISAVGIEMVYVPTGAFKLGDSESEKTFRKTYTPIPEEYDLVSTEYETYSSGGPDEHPELAADRINDNDPTTSSCWVPNSSKDVEWRIDFGEKQSDRKTIRFFGVNASKASGGKKPTEWCLYGSNEKGIVNMDEPLWKGGPDDWVEADDAYPIEHAIEVKHPQPFRYYHIYIKGMQGNAQPIVKSIGMTDQKVDKLLDYSVLIDGPTLTIDSLKGIGARDGENWSGGSTVNTYPNGFLGFYAMKYEISQEQYVKFLNKLTRAQQEALVPAVKNLKRGDYIFGRADCSSARNGIVIADKQDGKPYIFTDSLEIATGDELSINGETIACNYMSVTDMLAYADWIGLRPLSELEYEKMSRRPFPTIPLPHEFAWNTTNISVPTGVANPGTANETAIGGNANYGNITAIGGPLRVGAFAAGKTGQEAAGVGFYGAMDLSGNLAEIYYNANTEGRKFKAFQPLSHGNGYLNTTGTTDVAVGTWPQSTAAFAVRGGSYKDSDKFLAVSDRSRHKGYLPALTTRDSTVTFRLGYSAVIDNSLDVYLTLQNGRTSKDANAGDTICGYTTTYSIVGNRPLTTQGAYTFIWYMLEEGGAWRILEQENDASLTYSKFVNNLPRLKHYMFKRLMITPDAYAMTAPVTIVVDQVANAQINTLVDTIDAFENSQGGFYVASTIPSEFSWRWVYRGRAQKLNPYGYSQTHSHYVPDISHFRRPDGTINYGENLVQVERTTKGVGSCFTTVDLTVFIKDKGDPNELAYSDKVKCGNFMRDRRDNQIYPTVAIGNQCWMAKNLNVARNGNTSVGICYRSSNANCIKYGRMYTWNEANASDRSTYQRRGICPAGWHIPSNSEWRTLTNALVTTPAKQMKTSKYWAFTGIDYLGKAENPFRAVPGGYFVPGASVRNENGVVEKDYVEANTAARWWTSEYYTYTYRVQVGGYWYCSNHGYNPTTSACTAKQWYPTYSTTRYSYDGYYVGIKYNNNTSVVNTYLRYNANALGVDRLYIRCVKD